MATKTLQFRYLPGTTGLTCDVYPHGGGTAIASGLALNAVTPTTLYQASMTALASGCVLVDVKRNGNVISTYQCFLVEAVGNYDLVDAAIANQASHLATLIDGAVNLQQLYRAEIAFLIGKLTLTSVGDGTATLSFKMQDGTTEAFHVPYLKEDGTRSTTGVIN